MPTASSSSARVTFLDVAASVDRLRAAARRLCETDPTVVAVVLFGSLAQGSATPSSDADLLVVLRRDGRRVIDRVPDYTRPFEGLGMSTQVFPWTEPELAARLSGNDPFAREILRTGRTLAGGLEEERYRVVGGAKGP